jgi:acetolactate decarboxylase
MKRMIATRWWPCRPFLVVSLLTTLAAGCGSSSASDEAPRHSLFQVSTLGALSRGVYDGALTVDQLVEKGGFGLGTFDRVDGEMIVLDGVVYQVRTDGQPRAAAAAATTPFAAVTDFVAEAVFDIDGAADYGELQARLDGHLSTLNVPVAIKITGRIPALNVRSVPPQDPPYPPLAEVIEEQTVFELRDVAGTLVGFRTPAYLSELNAAGYHFHFLSDDRAAGGHVLSGRFAALDVELQYLRDFEMWLPPPETGFDSACVDPVACAP